MNRELTVTATWDAEASVWVAESEHVPGLVTEADSLEALVCKLRTLIPELLEATGGGRLVTPGDADELADALDELRADPETRYSLGATGQINVREQFNPHVMANATLDLIS